ncbi:1-phosphofructokinase family hexose kinase [Hydrogenophaga sp. MI9]|uniref:1-phosphofructokinase family hexose kinase n=1 Tax=Hydrogenophaga sp. MI9 TaxID=3453719 RepID=UPI003EEB5219
MSTTAPLPSVLCLTMNPSVDLATETENVVPTHKLRCGDTLHDAGGGGINVARVLTRLGGRCVALCPTGGPSGHWLEQRMRDEGLDSVFLPIADETRVSFTVHEHSTGAEFRFVMPGPHLSEAEWMACLTYLEGLTEFPALLVASGSLPPGVPTDFYARLARLCRQRGARLVVDASGPALSAALVEGVFLFKPNLKELGELTGETLETPAQWQAGARRLVNEGKAEIVALTLGHQGALLVTRDAMWSAPPLDMPVASAVGAGDSFVGGLVWAWQLGMPLDQAFAWGVAAGSAALLNAGTSLAHPEDMRRLREQVRVTRVGA